MQHLLHGIPLDDMGKRRLPLFVEFDVDRVCVAKQIMQIPQHLLIGTHQKRPQVVRTAVEPV